MNRKPKRAINMKPRAARKKSPTILQDRKTPSKIRALKTCAATLSIVILSSGCVVGSESPPEEQGNVSNEANPNPEPGEEDSQAIAISSTITTTTDIGHELQIDVHGLERLENDLIRLRIGVTNNSNERFTLFDGLSEEGDQNTASQITLIDTENQQRYLSYDQSDGSCLCSTLAGGSISQGETAEMWVAYPEPPPETEVMTITTPLTPPLFDVPVSTSSETIETRGLAEPEILDLTMISDSLEDQTGRTESNDEISIILSSDVLFETNSAELNSESQEILNQVAREINEASSNVVQIDGHADNTGSDSVNLPLSQERAESVENILSEMVNRNDVTFEVEGHGSSDPIAENNTEEGRERNRRVSVTFEK
jgi:outer membrane protein OmpA-like peptidoglycan-associated protein